jgi:DNA-directed RNA polymerase subunit E'/Rpb7
VLKSVVWMCRYANKLIPSVGLALLFYDILTCGEGKIKWGDGLVWHKGKSASRYQGAS